MAAACASSCLREPGEPMIVLRRCRRGRDDEDAVEGTRNLGLQGRAAREGRGRGDAQGEERGGEADGRSPRALSQTGVL